MQWPWMHYCRGQHGYSWGVIQYLYFMPIVWELFLKAERPNANVHGPAPGLHMPFSTIGNGSTSVGRPSPAEPSCPGLPGCRQAGGGWCGAGNARGGPCTTARGPAGAFEPGELQRESMENCLVRMTVLPTCKPCHVQIGSSEDSIFQVCGVSFSLFFWAKGRLWELI